MGVNLQMLNVAVQPNKTRNMWGKCQVLCKDKLQSYISELTKQTSDKKHEK